MSSKEELNALKVTELKALCKDKGLSQVGVKADLVTRLVEHSLQKAPSTGAEAEGKAAIDAKETAGSVTDKTPDSKTETDKAVNGETPQNPKDPTEDAKAAENTAEEKPKDAPENVTATSDDQVSTKPDDVGTSDEKDVKQKLIDRAKRFGVPVPEVEEDKKIGESKAIWHCCTRT